MKSIFRFNFLLYIFFLNSCIYAQNPNRELLIIEMLEGFYTEYNEIWTVKPPLSPEIFEKKIDSLLAQYCTKIFYQEVKIALKNGQDLMTKDLGSVDLNENLRVEKDASSENIYIVSFNAYNSDAAGKSVKQEVVLRVSVVKEGERYLINEVK